MPETLTEPSVTNQLNTHPPALPQRIAGTSRILRVTDHSLAEPQTPPSDAEIEGTSDRTGFPGTAPVYITHHGEDLAGREKTENASKLINRLAAERLAADVLGI